MTPAWAPIAIESRRAHARMLHATAAPRVAQANLLLGILRDNADTQFGRAHGFSRIETLDQYREKVPVRTYADFEPWIARCAEGTKDVLTAEGVVAFEETGGSTGGVKLIPYTPGLLAAFREAILAWLGDLLARRPVIADGRAYASVSPALRQVRETRGGHPIGLASDGAYLGDALAAPFSEVVVTRAETAWARDLPSWRTASLVDLASSRDLAFISVFSPSFLTLLLDALEADPDPVLERLRGDPEAEARLRAALQGGTLRADILWPRLDTISCWTDGPSRALAATLARRCPHARIEPKGLLATESAITIGLDGARGGAPALLSAFLEFIDVGETSRLVDELEDDRDYRVILTTPGGLYRYDIGDRVRCVGRTGAMARLEFVGRAGLVSDLVGEKLTDDFVAGILARLPGAAMLVAQISPMPHYELWTDMADDVSSEAVDAALCTNPQYRYARALGQLAAIVVRSKPGFLRDLHDRLASAGRRLGDLKAQCLLPWDGQADDARLATPQEAE